MLSKLNILTIDWPLRQDRLFPRSQPLIVEIGFGNGDYLLHLATARPDCNILGLEISGQSMAKAEAKIEKLGLTNARPIHCRAESALWHLLRPQSVREFHINYPDPWFKKRHGRRRLIQRGTVELLTSRLEAGGLLLLATDIRAYAEMAHAILSSAPGLQNEYAAAWRHEVAGRFRTKYEEKGYREGRRGHFFRYRRDGSPVPHPPLIEELAMPHVSLRSPLNIPEIVDRFAPQKLSIDGAHIAILHAWLGKERDVALFEVVVEEPSISQHSMIRLAPRAGAGEYIVKLTTIGHARSTLGMHRAVAAVGDWVAGLDGRGQVVERRVRV
ncbi:MAG: tRNA (guanosine(46)-N7)-methyltransferase TrmB [Chloroflexi bacterium]|nr:tRNA (guanosine(46)-N7)-methyltransferase TrmB [Chloroflexota bacterium]MCY4246579.1 tRNA (guanosine(46)-N7)-methyltransferase TrmB [Chloroflexota bacterium]